MSSRRDRCWSSNKMSAPHKAGENEHKREDCKTTISRSVPQQVGVFGEFLKPLVLLSLPLCVDGVSRAGRRSYKQR